MVRKPCADKATAGFLESCSPQRKAAAENGGICPDTENSRPVQEKTAVVRCPVRFFLIFAAQFSLPAQIGRTQESLAEVWVDPGLQAGDKPLKWEWLLATRVMNN